MDSWVTAKTAATMAYYDRQRRPAALRTRRHLHRLRRLPLLDPLLDQPQPQPPLSGWTGFEPNGKRAVGNDAYERGHPPRLHLDDLRRAAGEGRAELEVVPGVGQLHRQQPGVLRRLQGGRAQGAGQGRTACRTWTAFYAAVRGRRRRRARSGCSALLEEGVTALTAADRSLFERALRRGRAGHLADRVRRRRGARAGCPRCPTSCRPPPTPSTPAPPRRSHSATLVYQVLDALGAHPDVWRHTASSSPTTRTTASSTMCRRRCRRPGPTESAGTAGPPASGIRVPLLVISPWTVGGYVCSEVFDHTSRRPASWSSGRACEEPNISAWRRTVSRRSHRRLRLLARAPAAAACEQPGAIPPFSGRWAPRAAGRAGMPRQEPGMPARPARCRTSRTPHGGSTGRGGRPDGASRNTRRRLRPLRALPVRGGVRRAAAPGREGHGAVGRCRSGTGVPLHGHRAERLPPRVRRARPGAAAAAEVAHPIDAATAGAPPHPRNRGAHRLTFTVRRSGYVDEADLRTGRARSGEGRRAAAPSRTPAADAHGWYDLVVTVAEDPAFHRRLMGHIENGQASRSPAEPDGTPGVPTWPDSVGKSTKGPGSLPGCRVCSTERDRTTSRIAQCATVRPVRVL